MSGTGTTPIAELWRAGRIPIVDAVHLASGRSYEVELEAGKLALVEEFDLAEQLAEDPDWVTAADVTGELAVPGGGFLCRGEGSHGSEGFFARLDADRQLVWLVYLEESNPFADIELDGTTATFTSTSGVRVTVDIDHPVP